MLMSWFTVPSDFRKPEFLQVSRLFLIRYMYNLLNTALSITLLILDNSDTGDSFSLLFCCSVCGLELRLLSSIVQDIEIMSVICWRVLWVMGTLLLMLSGLLALLGFNCFRIEVVSALVMVNWCSECSTVGIIFWSSTLAWKELVKYLGLGR